MKIHKPLTALSQICVKIDYRNSQEIIIVSSRSQEALRQRRIAIGAERKADEAAASNEPWALGNLRAYQNVMANAMAARSRIVVEYLDERASRQPGCNFTP